MNQQQQQQPPRSDRSKVGDRARGNFAENEGSASRDWRGNSRNQSGSPPRWNNANESDSRPSSDRRYNNNYNNSNNNRDLNNRRNGRGGQPPRQNRSNLPSEQGVICSLKESFGFITCADRPEEIFFHYSELVACQVENLKLDDEVEFLVGTSSRSSDKLAAYQVRLLEPGTIVWETEDQPGVRHRGVVERPARAERGPPTSGQPMEGSIRILLENEAPTVENNTNNEPPKDAIMVCYRASDCRTSSTSSDDVDTSRSRRSDALQLSSGMRPGRDTGMGVASSSQRLYKGDVVEFSIVTERRSKMKFARSIVLLQSERERARKAREEELLATASVEQGVVTALKGDFGFLRSNLRKEPVYFHYSNVSMPEEVEAFELEKGQDVSFLVVVESSGDSGQKRRISARNVELRPSGSVLFYDLIERGVSGYVTRCPQPVDSGHSDETMGLIRLSKALTHVDDEGVERTVTEVVLQSKHSPGGDFSYRNGAAVGLWIRDGDTLLFDVVKELADGSFHAVPTKCLFPRSGDTATDDDDDDDTQSPPSAVRLIATSLVSRAEGVIHAIKDNYGFIHYAERSVDVHFRQFELLPDELQVDLRRNMGLGESLLRLDVGLEVQFDLSLHGKVTGAAPRGRHKVQERENLKAQRLLLLPSGTIMTDKVLATAVRGVVSKEDPQQPYAGTINLDQEIETMTIEERHPLVTKMIETFLNSSDPMLLYPDLLSQKEIEIVKEIAQLKGEGALECSHIPLAVDISHPGRLCIKKTPAVAENSHDVEGSEPVGEDQPKEGHNTTEEQQQQQQRARPSHRKKKPVVVNKSKLIKSVRYDKHSLAKEEKDGWPPGLGDVVTCNVIQSRKSQAITVENVTVVERNSGVVSEEEGSNLSMGVGIVKEVAASRQYGFISVMDETSSTPELLFFHMSSVATGKDDTTKPGGKVPDVRKGDEVKFSIGHDKNEKKIAIHIEVLPKGSLSNNNNKSADKNSCRGFILMVPSHTSLAATPVRHSSLPTPGSAAEANSVGNGRWDNVKDNKAAGGGSGNANFGRILLLEDPSNLFSKRDASNGSATKGANRNFKGDSPTGDVGKGAVRGANVAKADPACSDGVHLFYKVSAIALHGSVPKRGDLVSFSKAKGGEGGVKDIRVVSPGAATIVKGRLEQIVRTTTTTGENSESGTAKFIVDHGKEGDEDHQVETFDVNLRDDVVGCDVALLKEKEAVEGILYQGALYGICRMSDMYLESKLGTSHKERPKLNLSVRKDRGGTIIAQSMMAKGPDGTNGFVAGWTTRQSKYATISGDWKSSNNDGTKVTAPATEVSEPGRKS